MSYAPIAHTIPQYDRTLYANWWLKAYEQGTSTPSPMATDAAAGTTLAKAKLDAQGFPITSGSSRFIPFIDGDYDLFLFPTEEEADANITVNAIQFADNLNTDPYSKGIDKYYDTLAACVTDISNISEIDVIILKERVSGNGGGVTGDAFEDVGNALAIASGQTNIVTLGTNLSLQVRLESAIIIVDQLGAINDKSTDNTTVVQAAIDLLPPDGGLVIVNKGCYFNLKSIDGSAGDYNLEYWARDERDAIGDGSNPGTNEYIYWSSNFNQDGGGTTDVNEWRFQAPYHPGIVLNNRENITKYGSGNVNAGQCSLVYKKNNFNQWQFQQGNLDTTGTPASGYAYNRNYYAISSYEVTYTVDLGTADFSVLTPSAGNTIVGVTSGAKARIRSAAANEMSVSWLYGAFEVGEDIVLSQYTQITSSSYSVATETSGSAIGTVTKDANYTTKTFRLAMATDSTGVGINSPINRISAGATIGGPLILENAQGGSYGSAVPSLRIVDDQWFPTTGFKFDIDPTSGGMRLLDHSGSSLGVTTSGIFPIPVVLADAETGGNTVTPTQSTFYKRTNGITFFNIGLLNINTAGLTAGNQIFIRNLPGSAWDSVNSQTQVNVKGVNITSTTGSIAGEIIANTSTIKLYQNITTGSGILTIAAITATTGTLNITGFYLEDQ